MSAILIPSSSESGRIPYDVRLETFLEEFSEILKEKNMTIITLQEKLTKVENERDLLKLLIIYQLNQQLMRTLNKRITIAMVMLI